jgi:hypothetical protein
LGSLINDFVDRFEVVLAAYTNHCQILPKLRYLTLALEQALSYPFRERAAASLSMTFASPSRYGLTKLFDSQ